MASLTMEKAKYDEVLRTVALELMYNNPQKWQLPEGPTAIEIARRNNLKLELVKKKLNILLNAGLVTSIGIKPKRWQFNEYNFSRMSVNDPIYLLIARYDDYDYEKFYF